MKLYLMQHGEAETEEVDPQRPLSSKGIGDVRKVSAFVQTAGVTISEIIHSGKLRAQQTAEYLSETISDGVTRSSNGIKPNDDVIIFSDEIDNYDNDLCIVGHLPFISKLASYLLVGETDQAIVNYTPGTIVCLERGDNEQWHIDWLIRPELIQG